jgi:hypothetical protein
MEHRTPSLARQVVCSDAYAAPTTHCNRENSFASRSVKDSFEETGRYRRDKANTRATATGTSKRPALLPMLIDLVLPIRP